MKAFHKNCKCIKSSTLFLLFYFYIYNVLKKIKAIKLSSKKQSIQNKRVYEGFLFDHMFSPWFFESPASVYSSCNRESYFKDSKREKIKLWQNGLVFCIILKIRHYLGLIIWNLWIAKDASKMSRKWVLAALDWDSGKHIHLYVLLGDRLDTEAKKMASRGLFLIIKTEGSPKAEEMANLFTTCIKNHDNSVEQK